MMTTQYKVQGVVGVVSNGPMRDVDAVGRLGIQYYVTGVTPAHGDMMVKEVGIPVTVGGMTVMLGDIVHMDLHGVVKFPANKMDEILKRAKKLLEEEEKTPKFFKDPKFSLEKWKEREKKYESV